MKFNDFIRSKFEEWEHEHHGGRKGFAAYLRVPPTSLSNWLNTEGTPGKASIAQLVGIYGDDIYKVLDMPIPEKPTDDQLEPLAALVLSLPESKRRDFREKLTEYAVKLAQTIIQDP